MSTGEPTAALFVVVSGRPGSGKSTLAARLAPALGLSLLAKDTVKQALRDVLGADDVDASRALGRAARRAVLAVAATSAGAVLDSVWPSDGVGPDRPLDAIRALPGTVVEVHCAVDPQVAARRYRTRVLAAAAAEADVAGGDSVRHEDEQAAAGRPVDGGWPVLVVDTSGEVDLDLLVHRVRAAADERVVRSGDQPSSDQGR